MRTAERARIAVVGLGRIGRLHAENLATRVGSAELVAVVDAVDHLARNVADELGVAWSSSLDEPLANAAVDGVVVAAPSEEHPELVKLVAAAGTHVFCEKPLGLDTGACAEAVAAAQAAGIQLQVGFQRRFDSDWQALKSAVDDGAARDAPAVPLLASKRASPGGRRPAREHLRGRGKPRPGRRPLAGGRRD